MNLIELFNSYPCMAASGLAKPYNNERVGPTKMYRKVMQLFLATVHMYVSERPRHVIFPLTVGRQCNHYRQVN